MDIKTEQLQKALAEYLNTSSFAAQWQTLQVAPDSEKLQAALQLIPMAVISLEKIDRDMQILADGGQKRAALVSLLDDAFKMPLLLELFDGPILGLFVDGLVKFYNTTIGHDWLAHLTDLINGLPE